MTRALSFRGDSIITTLTADVAGGDVTIPIAASDGWPTGSGAKPFVAFIISADLANHEKVLVASRTGLTLSIAVRGWDDTIATSFQAGATIMHVADAASMQAFSDHLDDPDPVGHSTLLNPTRHDQTARHQFGGALQAPSVMSPIATSGAVGTAQTVARGDHSHGLDASLAGPGLVLFGGLLAVVYDDSTITVSGDSLQVKAGGIGNGQLGSHAVQAGNIDPATVWPGLFPSTGVLTVVGQIADGLITRAKLAADAQKSVDVAWGYIDSAFSNADQTGIGSSGTTVTNMNATLTAVANRRYRTTVLIPRFQQISSAGEVQVEITDGSNVRVTGGNEPIACLWRATNEVGFASITLYEDSPSVGTHTRRVRVSTSAGSLNVPGATHPALILIEDIGPS
jgi:hypothetical protein